MSLDKPARIGSAIRELAAARTTPTICAAFVETVVQVWDIATQSQTGECLARYSFGASNLAMHPDGHSFVTGLAAGKDGLDMYKAPDAALLWRRERMSHPHSLRFAPSGKQLSCTTHNSRVVERIDAATGATFQVIRDAKGYIESAHGCVLIIPKSKPNYLLLCEQEVPIPKLTFAALDVAFTEDAVCLTESGGPVRFIDLATGAERWRYEPPSGSHILRFHYSDRDGFLYGILWHYKKGLFRNLVRFDAQTGQSTNICKLDSWNEAFLECTHQLVTTSGDIIDLSTGRVVGRLAFPQKQYPGVIRV